MANFYATYSAANAASATVTANQGTSPWIVSGSGTAGTAAPGVVTVQGIASGTAIPISGSITANNSSVSTTGSAVPASATMVGGTDGTNLRAVKVSTAGIVSVDGSASTQPCNITQFGSNNVVTGTGTGGNGIPRVTVSSDSSLATVSTVTAVTSITNTVTTDQVSTTTATFQDGSIAFGSLTTNYQTVITTGGALRNVAMRNNTNAIIVVSLDGGSTTAYTLDSGDAVSLDLKTLGRAIPTSTALQAKYSGAAPTSGSIRINGVY